MEWTWYCHDLRAPSCGKNMKNSQRSLVVYNLIHKNLPLKWMCLTLGLPPDAASSRLDAFAGSPLQVRPLFPTIIHAAAGDDSTFEICPTHFLRHIPHDDSTFKTYIPRRVVSLLSGGWVKASTWMSSDRRWQKKHSSDGAISKPFLKLCSYIEDSKTLWAKVEYIEKVKIVMKSALTKKQWFYAGWSRREYTSSEQFKEQQAFD